MQCPQESISTGDQLLHTWQIVTDCINVLFVSTGAFLLRVPVCITTTQLSHSAMKVCTIALCARQHLLIIVSNMEPIQTPNKNLHTSRRLLPDPTPCRQPCSRREHVRCQIPGTFPDFYALASTFSFQRNNNSVEVSIRVQRALTAAVQVPSRTIARTEHHSPHRATHN